MNSQYEKECYADECLVNYRKNYGKHFSEMNLNTWEDVIIAVVRDDKKEDYEYYGVPCFDYSITGAPPLSMGQPVNRDNVSVTALGPKNDSLDHFDNIHNHRIEAR